MATTTITGRDISLTINSLPYDPQTLSLSLKTNLERNAYETIDGKVFWALDTTAEISVTVLADWGANSPTSICEAMWTAASTAPNTALAYTFVAATGSGAGTVATFTGNLYPVFPDGGGSGKDAQTVSYTMQGTAKPTMTLT
jgi:hypothetical protein